MPVILPNQISYSSFQHPSNDKVSLEFVHVLAYIPLTDKQTARNTKLLLLLPALYLEQARSPADFLKENFF